MRRSRDSAAAPPARIPKKITARKTRKARATSVSRCAVGGSTPGNERRPVGDEDEDEQGADERAIRRRLGLHGVADLPVHRVDDQFDAACVGDGSSDSRRVASNAPPTSNAIRSPGDDHGGGDRHGADVEQVTLASGEIMASPSRASARRRSARSGRRAPLRAAARRPRTPPRSARRPSATKRPRVSATAVETRPPPTMRRVFRQRPRK